MNPLLQVEQLSAGYGDAVVLHGVSLSLAEGQTLALLGRNGVGKTTFIDTLAGATRQHGGAMRLNGVAKERKLSFMAWPVLFSATLRAAAKSKLEKPSCARHCAWLEPTGGVLLGMRRRWPA